MVVDTSFVVDLMRERHAGQSGPAIDLLRRHATVKLRMPVFVACELELGATRSRDSSTEQQRLSALTEFMEVVYPQPGFATIYGGMVATLLQIGFPVPVMDALIACTAIQHSEPLITRDREHFARIPGLVVEAY
ncbi:MAG: type II toxin-antitoxin system VapC family toxin [Spirochaetales bacterium]|nr:type II toxin-antitoxin system VapC family toxin [Spirochaetales bacterium]